MTNPYGQPANNQPQSNHATPVQQPAAQKPWYKRAKIMIPLVLVVLVIVGIAAGGGKDTTQDNTAATSGSSDQSGNAPQDNQDQEEAPAGKDVMQYVLETDGAPVNATFASQGANISQEQGVPSGWTKDIEFDGKWDALGANLSGQLDGSGTVTCRMLWNGQVVAENQSSGDYAVVTCSPDNSKM